MPIQFNSEHQIFHLYNDQISYILNILPNGQMGQLYFGKKLRHREDFSHLLEILSVSGQQGILTCTYPAGISILRHR